MTALVFAAPYTPPPPPVPKPRLWDSYRMTWQGANGTLWELDGSQGVMLLEDGLVGLDFPEADVFTSTSPATAGRRHRGSRWKEREVEWNLLVFSDESSAAWRALDRAFWGSFSVDSPGTWTATDATGRALSLPCHLVPVGRAFDRDPSRHGWALYQVRMIANDPFWVGPAITPAPWQAATPTPFFDAAGGPPLHISSSANLARAQITNPGDVSAWPVWRIVGPFDGVTITVDGGVLAYGALASGEILTIDTDPARATATKDGVDVFADVDPWDPRPIPAGQNVPLTIDATGLGEISVSITPRYLRGV